MNSETQLRNILFDKGIFRELYYNTKNKDYIIEIVYVKVEEY